MKRNNVGFWLKITIILTSLWLPGGAVASSTTEEVVIKALAKVQSERVRKIVSQSYLNQLFNDQRLAVFFPELTQQFASLNAVLGEHQLELARDSVQADIDNFRVLITECFPRNFAYAMSPVSGRLDQGRLNIFKQNMDDFVAMSYFAVDDDGPAPKSIAVLVDQVCDSVPANFTKSKATAARLFDDSSLVIAIAARQDTNLLNDINGVLSSGKCAQTYQNNASSFISGESDKDFYSDLFCYTEAELVGFQRLFAKNHELFLRYKKASDGISRAKASMSKATSDFELTKAQAELAEALSSRPSYERIMLRILDTYNALADARRKNERAYIQLQRVAMLFARITDAASVAIPGDGDSIDSAAENVAAVLGAYIESDDPIYHKWEQNAPVNWLTVTEYDYDNQRLKETGFFSTCSTIFFCTDNLFLGAYFGVAFTSVSTPHSGDQDDGVRAFGPIGIEYKLMTTDSLVLSLDYAFLDIGNAISNELLEKDYSASIRDVVSSSYFLSVASRRYPVAMLIGYQDNVPVGENVSEEGVFLSIAFDLPLFRFW